MMSAPADRDKDAVFKHKHVAETKGSACVAITGRSSSLSANFGIGCLAARSRQAD